MRHLALFILAILVTRTALRAEDPLVFISAFASGEKAGIHAFQFNTATGVLKPLHRNTDVQNPFFIAVSPDHRVLYAIDTKKFGGDEDDFVAAYALERSSGELKRLNEQTTRGRASCYLDVDTAGKTVVVANYSSGSVAALPVAKDGALGAPASFMQHSGSSIDPARQKGPNAHSIVISRDNRFALSADLGIDKIMIYRLDAATARLTPNEAQPFAQMPEGSGPRHLVFHPNGKQVYVISELKNTVTAFDYASDSGVLTMRQSISTLPPDFTGKSYCADVKITPNGRFLYGTNRGHDSISVFRVAEDGTLTLLKIEPSLGKGPQNLLVTPDGGWLLCANMPGNSVAVFRIDANTGGISPAGEPVTMPMPSCIRWVP